MIHIISAIQKKDRGIGYNNDLLYHIPQDMKRFRELTTGTVVIMGRKTWESLPEKFRPLPHRINIVISRNTDYRLDGALLASSFENALEIAQMYNKEIFVIGGSSLYEAGLPFADKLHLTIIDGDKDADTFFPEYKDIFTKVLEREHHTSDDGVIFDFVTLGK